MLDNIYDAVQEHMSRNIQIPEIIWLGVTLGILYFKLLNVKDARKDLKLLRKSGLNHFREVVATSILYTDSVRALVALAFFGMGIVAVLSPEEFSEFQLFLLVAALWFSAFAFLWTAWYSRITRRRLVEMWQDAQAEIEDSKKRVSDLETKAISLAVQTKEDTTALAVQTKKDTKDALVKSDAAVKKARKKKNATPESGEV